MSEIQPTPFEGLDNGSVTELADGCRRISASGRLRHTPARPWDHRCGQQEPSAFEEASGRVEGLDAFRA